MFKKLINAMLVIVMVAGIIVSVVGLQSPLFAQRERPDEGGGGGGSSDIYNRVDVMCAGYPTKVKTNCYQNGDEARTAADCEDI